MANQKFERTNNDVRLEDALRHVGVEFTLGRAKQTLICPLCKKRKLEVDFAKQVGQCMRTSCELGGFNATSLVAKVDGISTKEAWRLLKNGASSGVIVEEVDESAPLADSARIDRVFRAIFRVLRLSKRHEEDLKERGLTEEEIRSLGYVSISYRDRYSLPRKLLRAGFKESDLWGVPGFYRARKKTPQGGWVDGDIAFDTKTSGILIPFVDVHGRIRQLQIRQDKGTYKEGADKYHTVSTGGRKNGAVGHCYAHYAADRVYDMSSKSYIPAIRQNRILLTEGGLKADIIRKLSGGWPVLAVSGVTQYRSIEAELPTLKELGITTIDLIWDMDRKTNPGVAKSLKVVCQLLRNEGFEVAVHEWDDRYKGYDDFLAHIKRGIEPREKAGE